MEIVYNAIETAEGYLLTPYDPAIEEQLKAGQEFVKEYRERYKQTPDALAALGYDAAKILADAMTRAGSTDSGKVRDALAATKDFAGVTGQITIDNDRNAVKPAVVLKIDNGKFVYVETVKP